MVTHVAEDTAQTLTNKTMTDPTNDFRGALILQSGTLAGRPAAANEGRLYFATDDGSGKLYRDTGSAWALVADAGSVADHGAMTGLGDDDHTQYLLAAGTRDLSAKWYVNHNIGFGLATKGIVLKDSTGDYWRVSVGTLGTLNTTNIGTSQA